LGNIVPESKSASHLAGVLAFWQPVLTASDMIATQPIAAPQLHHHPAWGFRNCTVFSLNFATFS